MPQISIITRAFNTAALIAETIRSAQVQGFKDWEMVIIDDCSADSTSTVVEHFCADDPRIRLIRRAEIGGRAACRNQGIAAANGRYLAFLRTGDLWLPEKLERQLALMQQTEAAISYHGYRRFYPNGTIGRVLRGPERVTFDTLLHKNCVLLSTVMIDQQRTGPIQFDTDLPQRSDLNLWLQLTKSGQDILFLNDNLARHRVVRRRKWQYAVTTWRIFRVTARLTRLQTLLAMLRHTLYGLWKRLY